MHMLDEITQRAVIKKIGLENFDEGISCVLAYIKKFFGFILSDVKKVFSMSF